jgi:Protein of unknown function (DUF1569)
MPVNTAKVEGRRTVDYASLQEVLADAERLGSGNAKAIGNWSAGQVFRHLARAFDGSIDGLPGTFPWHIRTLAALFKNKLIAGPMPPGIKLPSDLAAVVMPEPTSTEEGLAELRAAIARLEQEPHRAKNPVFGELTNDEWNRIHLNHAKLHMSFLVPQ